MRLIVIGDIHDHRERLTATLELVGSLGGAPVDLVVLAGDVGCDPQGLRGGRLDRRAHDDSVRHVVERARDALAAPVVFVPGNHDMRDPPADSGGVNVDGGVHSLAGLRIAGLGGAGPDRFGFPYEWDEDEAEAMLELATEGVGPGALDILLSHAPPAGTALDRIYRGGRHVGSVAVRRVIERLRPRLFICGHIHEAWGVELLYDAPCLNAGALGEPFGQVLAWSIDWGPAGPGSRVGGSPGGPRQIESMRLGDDGATERRSWPV